MVENVCSIECYNRFKLISQINESSTKLTNWILCQEIRRTAPLTHSIISLLDFKTIRPKRSARLLHESQYNHWIVLWNVSLAPYTNINFFFVCFYFFIKWHKVCIFQAPLNGNNNCINFSCLSYGSFISPNVCTQYLNNSHWSRAKKMQAINKKRWTYNFNIENSYLTLYARMMQYLCVQAILSCCDKAHLSIHFQILCEFTEHRTQRPLLQTDKKEFRVLIYSENLAAKYCNIDFVSFSWANKRCCGEARM